MHGIRAARGTFVIMGDSDCSYDFGKLDPFVERLRAGSDLVMGNRFLGGIKQGAMPFLHKYLGNPVLSFLGRLFFTIPVGDFHCGLRGFRRDRMSRSGTACARHGVCERDDRARGARRDCRSRSADHAVSRRSVAATASANLARRMAALAVPADAEPALAVSVPGTLSVLHRGDRAERRYLSDRWRSGVSCFDIHTMLFAGGAMIVGLQMCLFSIFVRTAAATHSLLPSDDNFRRFVEYFTLERGIAWAACVALAGLVLGGLFAVDLGGNRPVRARSAPGHADRDSSR